MTALLFFLLVIIMFGVLIYFTPERVADIAQKNVSEQLQQDFSFTNARFNIFNGFVFEDIVLSPPDSSVSSKLPVHAATAKELSLRYSLRYILKRQLLISSAIIDSPYVHIIIKPEAAATAEADTIREESIWDAETKQSIAPQSLIALELKKFRLKNATITVDQLDSLQQQHIYLSDLSMSLDDVSFPRGDILAQDSLLRADFSVECRNSACVFEQKSTGQKFRFAATLDAGFDIKLAGLESIKIDASGEIGHIYVEIDEHFVLSPDNFSMPLRAELRGDLNGKTGTAHVDRVAFQVDGVPWLALSVQADSLLATPIVDLRVTESRIPIEQLITIAQPFVPKDVMPSIYLHNAKSHLSLKGTRVSGSAPMAEADALACQVSLAWQDFGATLNTNEHFLKNFDVTAGITALVTRTGVEQPAATMTVSYDSVYITTADGQKVFSGHASFNAETDLDAAFFPTRVKSDLSMNNVLGSDIRGQLLLTSDGELENIRGTGDFSLKNIDISPFTASQILSHVSVDATLALNSLSDISATAGVSTDSITIVQEFDTVVFSPVSFFAEFKGATDALFENFSVRSLTAKVNDFINAELTGKGSLAPHLQLDMNHLLLTCDLESAFSWLPKKLKAPVADTKITGLATLNSQFHGRISDADTMYHGGFLLETSDVSVNYENGLALLSDIGVRINGRTNSQDSTTLAIGLNIARAATNTLPDKQFRDNSLRLDLSMPDFSTLRIDTGLIQLPDLKTTGAIGGLVELINNKPLINATIKLRQNAADTIRLLPDIFYRGRNDVELAIQADSTRAGVTASIRTTDLTLSLPQNIRVDRINANISLKQNIDLTNGALVISPEIIVNTPSAGLIDYQLYRDYYYQPDKNPSYVTIRRAVVGDYLVENIRVEAFIGAGAVEIPMFSLDVYGGNVGGSFSLKSDTDDFLESSYRLSAHMSGINSALLLPTLQGKSKGTLKAHTEIRGKGFDVIKGIDLDGYFNITEIESKVAGNLLTLLDPEGKDTGIKITRALLNNGYKPRLMTFDIQHGYCYPAIFFDQPWYFPVKLSGSSIEFARIPIATLVSMNN